MNRTIPILENITKLSTNILMTNSNEYLKIYLEKILNKKSKSIKFIPEFNYESLELLYTSLQIMAYSEKLKITEYNKLDRLELKKYLSSLDNYKEIIPYIKSDLNFINCIIETLSHGSYAYTSNNKVKFDNGIVLNTTWLVEFSNFLINSLILNDNLSNDRKTYSIRLVNIPSKKENLRQITKETEVYEYSVTRKDKRLLKFENLQYLKEELFKIEEYNFDLIKELTSKLGKKGYTLSVSKRQARFDAYDKTMLEKYLNENEHDYEELNEYIKETVNSIDSKSTVNKIALVEIYEILKELTYAYNAHYSIEKCRTLFDIDDKKQEIYNAISIANFYIYYIFDEDNLHKTFDYEKLKLEDVKPSVIDYETDEYKNILSELSTLNKKVVIENRNINRLLSKGKIKVTSVPSKSNEKNAELAASCRSLEKLVSNIKHLREQLSKAKNSNNNISNINKTKIRYIKESIITGKYGFDKKTKTIIFDAYSPKDLHKTLHLEISTSDFDEYILSEYNQRIRIEFYQK